MASPFSTDATDPVHAESRTFRARDAVLCVLLAAIVLALFEGPSIRRSGERMKSGYERQLVLAVGHPAGWLSDKLGLASVGHDATAWLSPDDDLSGEKGFASTGETDSTGRPASGPAPVTPDAFDPATIGAPHRPLRRLRKVLVTGDSMAQPLDAEIARRLVGADVKTDRDPHLGTSISQSDLLDWGKLSARQAESSPDAVVQFIGANEGFDLPGATGKPVSCCDADWAAAYATRVRQMMNTYRQAGAARVYWLTLPMPRDPRRQRIARTVNAAIVAAAAPYRAQVRILDMSTVFTPGGRYRASMPVKGHDELVRKPDGIHLNDAGSSLAADLVLGRVRQDFETG